MNLAKLRAIIEQNKKGIAIAGAAGVAGLALMNKGKKGAEPAAAAGDVGPTTGSQYGLTPLPATGGVYDSSSSDVYNALQPQLESLGKQQSALEELLKKTQTKPATPIPVAAPPKPKYGGFFQVAGRTDRTFIQDERGVLDWLTLDEMKAFNVAPGGKTDGIRVVPQDSSFWKEAKYLGSNPLKK